MKLCCNQLTSGSSVARSTHHTPAGGDSWWQQATLLLNSRTEVHSAHALPTCYIISHCIHIVVFMCKHVFQKLHKLLEYCIVYYSSDVNTSPKCEICCTSNNV